MSHMLYVLGEDDEEMGGGRGEGDGGEGKWGGRERKGETMRGGNYKEWM